MDIGDKIVWVTNFMDEFGTDRWFSPTEIGRTFGQEHGKILHSAWASPILLKMVELGMVVRNDKGHYQRTNES